MTTEARRAAGTGALSELITDREAAALLGVGSTRFFELLREEDFPAWVLLGPRGRRHVRAELLGWALSRRAPKSPTPPPAEALPVKRRGRPRKIPVGTSAAEATI